jgi:hypothetical protein
VSWLSAVRAMTAAVAWSVEIGDRLDDEPGQVVVFARNAMEARRLGVDELRSHGVEAEFDCVEAVRSEGFDQYAPGPITCRMYLAEGWWWSCSECEHMVSDDGCDDCVERAEEEAEREADSEGVPAEECERRHPVIREHEAFCDAICAERTDTERARRAALKAKMRAEFERRWPGATDVVYWTGPHELDFTEGVEFLFPGSRMHVMWEPWKADGSQMLVHLCDLGAWYEFNQHCKAGRPTAA